MIFFYWLILIMPLENHPIWEHHFGPFTVVKYIGLACIAYSLMHLVSRKGGAPPFWGTWQAGLFTLFFVISTISYFTRGINIGFGESAFTVYASFFLLYFVTLTVIDSPERLRHVLLVAIGSVGLASVYVLREWQKSGFATGFRPGWVVGDANYFTVSVSACLPLALFWVIAGRRRWERIYCLACMGTTLGATVLGASRGGLIALVVSCTWLTFQTKYRWKILGIMSLLLIPALVVAPNSPIRRLFHPNWTDVASTSNHVEIFKAGLRMIAAHPILGVGLGNFRFKLLDYADPSLAHAFIAHDAYLEVAAEMGVPALLIYIAMLGLSLYSLSRTRRAAATLKLEFMEMAAIGVEAGLIGSSTAVLFVSGQNTKLYWLMIFLSMVLPSLVRAPREREFEARASSKALRPATQKTMVAQLRPSWKAVRKIQSRVSASSRHPNAVRKELE